MGYKRGSTANNSNINIVLRVLQDRPTEGLKISEISSASGLTKGQVRSALFWLQNRRGPRTVKREVNAIRGNYKTGRGGIEVQRWRVIKAMKGQENE